MRVQLIVFLVFLSSTMFGQSIFEPILPNATLPSPEATSMTEFGNGEAVEFSGKINLNIPVYNYTAGQLKWPISLNYCAAGVKIDDFSTWTGINWKLNSHGVISRTVNDAADESYTGTRDYIDEGDMLANASNICSENSQYYYNLCFYNKDHDTEVDIFRFNFNGYSGSFYLDKNFIPVYLENENEVKIEIIGTASSNLQNLRESKTFLITTPDGVKYYFGGNETEQSSSYSANRHNAVLANTSFYLYKIQHPISGTILFEYETLSGTTFNNRYIHNIRAVALGSNPAPYLPDPTRIIFGTLLTNLKYLSKIKSIENSEEVFFNSSQTSFGNYLGTLRQLDNIEIKKTTASLKKIDLSYLITYGTTDPQTNTVIPKRFFLEKVEIDKDKDQDGNKHEIYLMEYDAPNDLPKRLSYAQDILGYYNGKTGNTSLVPYNPVFAPSASSFGDRSPVFSKAKNGTLTKITYPTKGYSTFEYEPAPGKEKVYEKRSGFLSKIEETELIEIPGYDLMGDLIDFPTVFKNQTVKITIETNSGSLTDKLCKVQLDVIDLTDSLKTKTFIKTLGELYHSSQNFNFDFIKDHTYQIVFKYKDAQTSTNTFTGTFSFEMFTGYRKIDGYGVRIKSQNDFGLNSSQPTNIKSYKYTGISNYFDNVNYYREISVFPIITPELANVDFSINNQGGTYDDDWGYYYNYHNDALKNSFSFETYPIVAISYGGDNFENGGVEKYFSFEFNDKINRVPLLNDGCYLNLENVVVCGLPSTRSSTITRFRNEITSQEVTDNSMYNGKLFHERFYKKSSNGLEKIKEVTYDYSISLPIKKAVNLVGFTLFGYDVVGNHCNAGLTDPEKKPMSSCYLGYYYMNSKNIKLNSVVTTEFIQPVPISLYYPYEDSDLSGITGAGLDYDADIPFTKIITTQTFDYGSLRGLPTKVTTSTSDSAVIKSTENTYVNTSNTLTGLTSGQTTSNQKLLDQNRVETPIEVRQYSGSELLSTQRTLHKSWNNNPDMVLPETIQTAKGTNNLEDRVVFSEYDAKGNPTLFSYKDGSKVKYLYNSNNQVYLKIENFTGTLDPNANPISGDPCTFINQYPNSQVTVFTYDPTTNLLVQTMDSNCKKTTYVYDSLLHLKQIKDHDGVVIKEFDTNYRPQ